MVEINLTSNVGILGVSGKQHPLPIYLKYDVPVALSTDDEGVSRIDLTHEFVRAVETYDLSYSDLKRLVRTSLEHSFLPGASLWREQDAFTRDAGACSADSLGTENPSSACRRIPANKRKGWHSSGNSSGASGNSRQPFEPLGVVDELSRDTAHENQHRENLPVIAAPVGAGEVVAHHQENQRNRHIGVVVCAGFGPLA